MNVLYCLRRARMYHGDRVAIDYENRLMTYREFGAQVDCSAGKLAAMGLRKGDRVAVWMLNSPEYLDLFFSIAMAGGIIVPLNTRWHINDLVFALRDSEARFLFVDDRFAGLAGQIRELVPELEAVLFWGAGECPGEAVDFRPAQPAGDAAFEEPHEDDVASIFYTSGTTGGPKGAMLTHRNVYANTVHTLLPPSGFNSDFVYLHAPPMFHLADAGAIHGLTVVGARHCFLTSFDAGNLLRAIERYRITHVAMVPTMVNMVINHPRFAEYDLSSLRRVSYGASPMPLPLLKQAMEKLPGSQFYQGYGMTEVACLLTVLSAEDHGLQHADGRLRSAGKPVTGVEIRVVDNNDVDVPIGAVGEVIARGPNVMKGYWKRPEISAEVLRGGWMHTGDLGRFDHQGFLYILDRKKDMIKTGSENVYSPEVESVVCGHPAILEAAVIGVPDPKWGEAILAVVVLRSGATLTGPELIAWCRERLTAFKCPSAVAITDVLPKGGTGKVQKAVLREQFAGPAAQVD
ncbi:MAG: long-chain-fatty-acid--CoA ligase [Acidobacteriota bacterium]|nr:long-chain-fatty-acid--CoA ligase [Acidobacteriota bacterium]